MGRHGSPRLLQFLLLLLCGLADCNTDARQSEFMKNKEALITEYMKEECRNALVADEDSFNFTDIVRLEYRRQTFVPELHVFIGTPINSSYLPHCLIDLVPARCSTQGLGQLGCYCLKADPQNRSYNISVNMIVPAGVALMHVYVKWRPSPKEGFQIVLRRDIPYVIVDPRIIIQMSEETFRVWDTTCPQLPLHPGVDLMFCVTNMYQPKLFLQFAIGMEVEYSAECAVERVEYGEIHLGRKFVLSFEDRCWNRIKLTCSYPSELLDEDGNRASKNDGSKRVQFQPMHSFCLQAGLVVLMLLIAETR